MPFFVNRFRDSIFKKVLYNVCLFAVRFFAVVMRDHGCNLGDLALFKQMNGWCFIAILKMIVCIKKILNSEDLSISMILVSLVFYIPTMLLKVSDKMRPLANKLCFVFVFAGFFFWGGGLLLLFFGLYFFWKLKKQIFDILVNRILI